MALLPGAASAAGLTGPFDPNLWKLEVTVTAPPAEPVVTQTDFPDYECADEFELSCIEFQGADSFLVVGSGSLATGPTVSTDWKLTYGGPSPVELSFDWEFIDEGTVNRDFGYFRINDSQKFETSETSGPFSESYLIQPGDTLTFGVRSTDNNPTPGQLLISNFSTSAPVPGPLPLFGAAATFAWSRKLRTRVKDSRSLKT